MYENHICTIVPSTIIPVFRIRLPNALANDGETKDLVLLRNTLPLRVNYAEFPADHLSSTQIRIQLYNKHTTTQPNKGMLKSHKCPERLSGSTVNSLSPLSAAVRNEPKIMQNINQDNQSTPNKSMSQPSHATLVTTSFRKDVG